MNKGLKITSIVLLSIVVITLSIFLTILIKKDFKFNGHFSLISGQSNKLIDSKEFEKVKDIYISSDVADIYINESEDNIFKVELYSDKAKTHKIELSDEDLKIELEEKEHNTFFGKGSKIILYVPSDFSNTFNIKNNSGDLETDSYKNAKFVIDVTTGDIKINKANSIKFSTTTGDINTNEVNDIKGKCTTGDIEVGTVNNSLKLKVTTGDIKINSIKLKENSKIETTTGDVRINNINDIYVNAKAKIGDVNINKNNRFAKTTLSIKSTTGDIKVD